jgi:hypothetical protein
MQRGEAAGVGEAPRQEVAGSWAQVVQRARGATACGLWGLDLDAAQSTAGIRRFESALPVWAMMVWASLA